MNQEEEYRKVFEDQVKEKILGPGYAKEIIECRDDALDEIIDDNPLKLYSTGVMTPYGTKSTDIDDDGDDDDDDVEDEDEEGDNEYEGENEEYENYDGNENDDNYNETYNLKKNKFILELDEFQYKHVKKYSTIKEDKCAICLQKYKGVDIIKEFYDISIYIFNT